MKGRLIMAAAAAALLTACPKPARTPKTTLVSSGDNFAIAVQGTDGKIVYYPLPKPAYVVLDGQVIVLDANTQQSIRIIPHCLCGQKDCDRFCMPTPPWILATKPPENGGVLDRGTGGGDVPPPATDQPKPATGQ